MKKTLLITTGFPPQTGGVSEYWKNLSREAGNGFHILAPELPLVSDRLADELSQLNVNLSRTKFYYSWLWPHWLPLLIKVIYKQLKENYVYLLAGQPLPIGTILFLLKKIRVIKSYFLSCHGMDLELPQGWKRKLLKRVLLAADKVIVNSDYTARLVKNFGVTLEKVVKIKPCPQKFLDTNTSFRPELPPGAVKVLLSVCRLVPRKGVDLVIRSLPALWKKYPDLVYLIVGDGPDSKRLHNLVDLYISENNKKKIVFAGEVSAKELSSYYRVADIFVLPTRNIEGDVEGFGMVFLEAGLFKLPVVAGDSGGVGEAVKNNKTGLLIRPESQEGLIHALDSLLANEDWRRKLGRANYDWAVSFSWQEEAGKLKKILS